MYGQAVVFSAVLSSTGTNIPTGTVTSKDGATNLASVALANGVASLSRSILGAESHITTVVYNGDASNASSTSPALLDEVNPATTVVSVRSSVNPSRAGQPVRFTAAVISATGAVTSGTVMFVAGSTTLGAVTLAGGSASISSSALAIGTNTVTVTYSGNSNMNPSSASLGQAVR